MVLSELIFPDTDSDGLALTSDGGEIVLKSVEVCEVAT